MTNVISFESKKIYRSYPERELERMWQDISTKNYKNLSNKLLKAISKDKDKVKTVDIPLYSKRMFDSEKVQYVPFNIWGAHYIVNVRKENLLMQIFLPLPYQVESDDPLKGWSKYNCEHLQKSLMEKDSPVDFFDFDACAHLPIVPNQKGARELGDWIKRKDAKRKEETERVKLMMEEGKRKINEYREKN